MCYQDYPSQKRCFTGLLACLLATVFLLAACTKEGNTIYLPTPGERQPATTPLVTVIYGPNSLGDRAYCDKIYRGIEASASRRGFRTLQLMPEDMDQGQTYLEMMFQQMEAAQDTVRRLFIATSPVYDEFIRKNNRRLEHNPYADLLYLETSTPLEGKGSTLYIDYYGAMYMAGCLSHYDGSNLVLMVLANPYTQTVVEAGEGFVDGFQSAFLKYEWQDKPLVIRYLSDEPGGGFQLADTTALRIIEEVSKSYDRDVYLVPVCGGAMNTFFRVIPEYFYYMSIDDYILLKNKNNYVNVIKNIDTVLDDYLGKWEIGTMPKHQTLGLEDGGTDLYLPKGNDWYERYADVDSLRQVAIRKEKERYEK